MVEIVLDAETLRIFSLFEKVTRTRLKDLVDEEDRVTFVVEDKHLGKAIGKGAVNLKRLRDILDKDVDVVGYADETEAFVKNVFHRHRIENIDIAEPEDAPGKTVTVRIDPRDKGKAIGKGGRNVGLARTLLERHHNVTELTLE